MKRSKIWKIWSAQLLQLCKNITISTLAIKIYSSWTNLNNHSPHYFLCYQNPFISLFSVFFFKLNTLAVVVVAFVLLPLMFVCHFLLMAFSYYTPTFHSTAAHIFKKKNGWKKLFSYITLRMFVRTYMYFVITLNKCSLK